MDAADEVLTKVKRFLWQDLNPEEKILWAGQPQVTAIQYFRVLAPTLIVIVLVLCITGALVYKSTGGDQRDLLFMAIPFGGVLIALVIIFATSSSIKPGKVFYALSNQRIFSLILLDPLLKSLFQRAENTGFWLNRNGEVMVKSAELDALPPTVEAIRPDGSGSLVFSYMGKNSRKKIDPAVLLLSPQAYGGLAFVEIPDARSVAEQVKNLVNERAKQQAKEFSGQQSNSPSISRAPREVPLSLTLTLFACGTNAAWGWALTLFLSFWCWTAATAIMPMAHLDKVILQLTPSEKTDAKILATDDRKYCTYSLIDFQDKTGEHVRTMLETKQKPSQTKLSIEYSQFWPMAVRMVGEEQSKEDALNPCVFFALPMVAAGSIAAFLFVYILREGLRTIYLLRNGHAIYGRVLAGELPYFSVNNRVVLSKRNYEFTVNGKRQIIGQLVDTNWSDKDRPIVFYDSQNVDNAVYLSGLPGHPTISERGKIQANPLGFKMLFLLLPLAVLCLNVGFINHTYMTACEDRSMFSSVQDDLSQTARTSAAPGSQSSMSQALRSGEDKYVTVFDVSREGFVHWLPAYLGVGFALAIAAILVYVLKKEKHSVRNVVVMVSAFIFICFWLFAVTGDQLSDYSALISAYKKGACEKVEGTVTDFDPMPYGGHKQESFNVNGKKFSYSEFTVEAGFNKTASHGGPIREGLHVRIWHKDGEIARLDIAR